MFSLLIQKECKFFRIREFYGKSKIDIYYLMVCGIVMMFFVFSIVGVVLDRIKSEFVFLFVYFFSSFGFVFILIYFIGLRGILIKQCFEVVY